MMDKDFQTRPFFRHLVAQGHTVMDVAYRLCPEVDIYGMVGDVKRAIAWMKTNASRYGVNPEKIVQTLRTYEITNTFGSPAMWKRVEWPAMWI